MSNKKPRGKVRDNKRKQEKRKNNMRKLLLAKAHKDKILKYENPLLDEVCKDVSPTEDLSFIKEMKDVLRTSNNGVGLAASQIGILKRVVVIDLLRNKNYKVMLNADYKPVKEKNLNNSLAEPYVKTYITEEGCLSYPNFYTKISRPRKIEVRYYDENMKLHVEEFEEFKAVLIQHEIDHTFGLCKVGDAWKAKQEKIKKLTKRSRVKGQTEEEQVVIVENE